MISFFFLPWFPPQHHILHHHHDHHILLILGEVSKRCGGLSIQTALLLVIASSYFFFCWNGFCYFLPRGNLQKCGKLQDWCWRIIWSRAINRCRLHTNNTSRLNCGLVWVLLTSKCVQLLPLLSVPWCSKAMARTGLKSSRHLCSALTAMTTTTWRVLWIPFLR